MKTRLIATLVLGLAASAAFAADDAPRSGTRTFPFKAFLDDKPIGEHRFTVVTDGATRKVTSEADFAVKFLGFNAYRYHHHVEEQWAGECLSSLVSSTDDDGKPASVKLLKSGGVNEITTLAGKKSEPGCLMTYAYWNPALREQKRLLNPQTGKVDAVTIERVGSGHVVVAGKDVVATDWRITGGESPVDVWLSDAGEWVGLDSMVSNGRHKLTYRLP
ncbi:MAG: DUF6134 family protein [Burkholderiaceae bacterium]|jgi:hypothetical protein